MSTQSELLRPANVPSISLDELLAQRNVEVVALPATARQEDRTVASGITVSSKEVVAGDVFVGVAGLKVHGARFAAQALSQGAVAVLTDAAGIAQLRAEGVIREDGTSAVPVVQGPTGGALRHEMARWAALIYGDMSSRFAVSGITGTNGKTTTAFFLDAIHRAAGERTALLGTVEMRLGEHSVPSARTTVEAPVLQGFFARCVEDSIDHLTMEVSSHALVLERVTGAHFDVVGFTNLQHDHLDFHNTMDEYFSAKARLFTRDFASRGVIVADDQWARRLVEQAEIDVLSISTPLSDDASFQADFVVKNVRLADSGLGLDFDIQSQDGSVIASHSPLLGQVNVSNAALATVMALVQGIAPNDILRGLNDLATVPGRMEVVSSETSQPLVIVDYAHTPDALAFALDSLRQSHHKDGAGKLIVVTGSAGERDRTKRPIMGRVCAQFADVVLITDDDPYSEDMTQIRDEVVAGVITSPEYGAKSEFERSAFLKVITPREQAIEQAIRMAGPGDTVLLAGRGHEQIQDIDGVQHVLDDRVYARATLARGE